MTELRFLNLLYLFKSLQLVYAPKCVELFRIRELYVSTFGLFAIIIYGILVSLD